MEQIKSSNSVGLAYYSQRLKWKRVRGVIHLQYIAYSNHSIILHLYLAIRVSNGFGSKGMNWNASNEYRNVR